MVSAGYIFFSFLIYLLVFMNMPADSIGSVVTSFGFVDWFFRLCCDFSSFYGLFPAWRLAFSTLAATFSTFAATFPSVLHAYHTTHIPASHRRTDIRFNKMISENWLRTLFRCIGRPQLNRLLFWMSDNIASNMNFDW